MHKNVDVLIWETNDIALSVMNCLRGNTDITLFDQKHTFPGFCPDIIVLPQKDIINALYGRIDALNRYPKAKIVHIKQTIDITVISIAMLVGFDGLVNTDVTKDDLAKILLTLGESTDEQISNRKRSRLIIDQFKDYNSYDFTFRQLAILCGLVRNIKHVELAKLLNTTKGDIFINECLICKKLNLKPEELHTPYMLKIYGALEQEVPYKTYTIPSRTKRPGYYIIPRFYD